MSVEEPVTGESFIFRTRKQIIAQPSVQWYNTYEARAANPLTSEDLESLAVGLATFERELLLPPFIVKDVKVSTWAEDSHPYNPMSFTTITTNFIGARGMGLAAPLDLRVTLRITRTIESGRQGKIFLRGCLRTDDVESPFGEFALDDPSSMNGELDDAMTAGAISSNFEGGPSNPTLAIIGATGLTRFVMGFEVGGVSIVKLNHKYFDRA